MRIAQYIRLFYLIILLLSNIRINLKAEDRVDYKYEDYSEENGRIRVKTSSILFEKELSENINTQGAFVYDGISGATPTGAPPIPGEYEVDTTEITDIRRAGFINSEYSFEDYLLTPQIAYSKESDYESIGLSLKSSRYFNDKNTTFTVGLGHDFDKIIPNFGMLINSKKEKDNSQFLVGLNQNINTKTILSLNLSLGYTDGYLSDPYKGVLFEDYYTPTPKELNELSQFLSIEEIEEIYSYKIGDPYVLFPEKRPSKKFRQVALISILHYLEKIRAGLDISYRFYHDDFGINSNTLALTWRQKITDMFILEPSYRFYNQSAANFYDSSFKFGNPDANANNTPGNYSSDFRLSDFDSHTYGLKLVYNHSDSLSFNISWKRYSMIGNDKITSPSAYIDADIVSGGFKIWY